MKIFITGSYEPAYNRNLVIFRGLEKIGVEVQYFPYTKRQRNSKTGKHIATASQGADAVFLPSFTHADVRFVRKYIGKQLLVFDPLISRYLSKVFDYKKVWRYSPRALKNYLKDYLSMHASDIVLADTQAHKDYYSKTFRIEPDKICVVPVGVDMDLFSPIKTVDSSGNTTFTVGFYGSLVPLQGVLKIAETAKILEKEAPEIQFKIIANKDGFEAKKLQAFLKENTLSNFSLSDAVPYKILPDMIRKWDIALGIFGDSLKADLVIPNKVYHYMACGVPTITKNTVAMQAAFQAGKNIVLCDNTPLAIAESIKSLYQSRQERNNIAQNALSEIRHNYDATHVAQYMVKAITDFKAREA